MTNIDYTGYFDYGAATPVDIAVFGAMQPYYAQFFYNPSAIYIKSRSVRTDLQNARHVVAMAIGARPSEIIFTAGGSEANNLAIKGILEQHPGTSIIMTAIEHESVLKPAKKFKNINLVVNNKGIVDVAELRNKLTDSVSLISVMYANNEIGSIQPIKEIAFLVHEVRQDRLKRNCRTPLYLHTDACQATNYLDINVARLGIDMMSLGGGKIYGPKQTGILYIRAGLVLTPLIDGGGQEYGLRSGTENIAGVVGFAGAIKNAIKNQKSEVLRLSKMRDSAFKRLSNEMPGIEINGPNGNKRLANNIHITIPGVDNEYLLMQLDERGFQVATGSACSASSDEPSHVLKALGLSDSQARSSLRLTMGRYTTKHDVNKLIDNIVQLVSKK